MSDEESERVKAILALADRIVVSTTRGQEFCLGVRAMAQAMVRASMPPADAELLRHPHAGLLVRCRARPIDLLVVRIEGGVGPHGQGTTVHVEATAHRGAGHRWRDRHHALKLRTWRYWTRGALILTRG